jgi:hypothetical protein
VKSLRRKIFYEIRKANPVHSTAVSHDELFFQTRSRALLDKYFEKSLADAIWKDAVKSKGEVGALDGDPLYDAQDMEIKKFAIGKASYENGKALVIVTFENFGQPKSFVFTMVNGRDGWRITNIEYGEGRSLRGYLKS